MSSHGKWNSLYSNGCRPYLKAADRILNSGGSGYHFVFGLENNGVSIEYTEGEILSVDVCGQQVTAYERDIVIMSEEADQSGEMWESIEPVNILTENYAKIGQIIGTTTFEEMAARVESIKFCCIRDKQNDSLTIKPVWLMTVSGGCRFWFDPETGELLGYLRAEVN